MPSSNYCDKPLLFHCNYQCTNCDVCLFYCDYHSHYDTLWVPSPQNMVVMFRITHSVHNPPPIASQPNYSNPPPQAHTNHTPSPPSLNHLNFLCILQWNSCGLSSTHCAELCSFLSSNHYNLVLLQETNLFSSRNFKVTGYSVYRADCALIHRCAANTGNRNDGGVLTLINSDLFLQMVPLPTLTLSAPASDYLYVKINFQKHFALLFLNVYSPPIRNTQINSRSHTFFPELLLIFPDTFILKDFNAHYSIWATHISPDNAGNSVFSWI